MKKLYSLSVLALVSTLGFGVLTTGCTDKMVHHDTLANTVEQAQTKEDHLAIAASYEEARMLMEKARKHDKLATAYKPKITAATRHCRNIATKLREAAAEDMALANIHRDMAQKL